MDSRAPGVVTPHYSGNGTVHDAGVDRSQTGTPGGNSGRFQCLLCERSFSRVEHLTRHSGSHAKERSLKCRDCHKGFYRIDALRRHEQVHNQPRRSSLAKGSRACDACAQARRKCSGERPCLACQKRSLECTSLRASTDSSLGKTPLDRSTTISTPVRNHPEQVPSRNPLHVNENPMGTSLSPPAPLPNLPNLQPQTENQGQMHLTDHQQAIAQRFSVFDSGFTPRSTTVMARPGIGNDRGMVSILAAEDHTSQASSTMNTNIISDELVHDPNSISSPSVWYQNNLSSINWLPDDYLPDYNQDTEMSLGLFGQTSHVEVPEINQVPRTRSTSINGLSDSVYSNSPSNARPRDRTQPTAGTEQTTSSICDGIDASSPDSKNIGGGSGRFYVDGDGARLPHIGSKRIKGTSRVAESSTPISVAATDNQNATVFDFPQSDPRSSDGPRVGIKLIREEIYHEYLRWFEQLCITSSHFPAFGTTTFLSLQTLSIFISYYLEFFQPILPFIHPSTFNVETAHWLQVLAMAAIGSHYIDVEDSGSYAFAMHEFLRRVINTLIETGDASRLDAVLLTQTQILNCVGMMYCGDERLMESAKTCNYRLAAFCGNEWMKSASDPINLDTNNGDVSYAWRVWCEGETRRRTGYSIWLLDCMWAFHFQMRPQLCLQDAKVPLPSQEVLWHAETAREWQQLFSCSSPSPSLHSAIQLVYIEKRLQPSMGEFSRILLIHALFRRTWEVADYFEQPLTLWSPTADRQEITTLQSQVWLPGIPTYSKWRNSACDCLDILHWHANSVIGAASGMEHTTVLHLHLARVVLLTPFRHIVNLVLSMVGDSSLSSETDVVAHRTHIQRWATEDQYKARLAMIHAGVLFWHVRRYSADGFYEPSSVFLATLALWAYGSFAQHTSEAAHDRELTPSEDAEQYPTFMSLDRPADDELVQLFVRRGATMRANITGVGNLCSPKGPGRVLLEGRKLLLGLKSWGYSRRALSVLAALEQQCR